MEIEELGKEVRKLEIDIAVQLTKLLGEFRDRTTVSPSYINVNMIDVTTVGELGRHYVVGSVTVDISIG